ncbi:MAG TPA: L,D-transpeptidase [Solirubrobacteraceae bacterium]|nr:L,D-transpeptidase [Solirubrobacteraceae bacterium]
MRWLLWTLAGVASLLVIAAVVVLLWSGASLKGDATALARVSVQPFGGSVASVEAFGARGRRIPIAVQDGRLTPLQRLKPGEQVSVTVQIRRPGWLSWALGSEHTEHLTLRAPVAHVKQRWLTVRRGAAVRVGFDQPVSAVSQGTTKLSRAHPLAHAQSTISLGRRALTGALQIAVAPRLWETVGAPTQVSWFPPSHSPVMVTLPASGSSVGPATKLYLTFSKPVDDVLGHKRPRLSPATPGHWHKANSHALVFVPAGMGAAFGSHLRVQLPHRVSVTAGSGSGSSGGALRTTSEVEWTVPPGSTLRLQQLLAQEGYLPLRWHASGKDVARTPSAEAQAAVDAPDGDFSWRYGNTPHQLQALWSAGHENTITRGALMKFEDENGLTVDGLPGAAVWHKLIENAIAGKRLKSGYSYVYVHRAVPQTLTLWHNGHTVLNAPANTGISGAETEPGTFPVFEHLPETTMSGTNPDGSHYEDPGIKWVSYFNGGDALHNFDRASFGTPQSLGCVELPLAASAQIYPYTPIGTLVTIES